MSQNWHKNDFLGLKISKSQYIDMGIFILTISIHEILHFQLDRAVLGAVDMQHAD